MQKNQEQQSKKSHTSMYQYPPPSSVIRVCASVCNSNLCLKTSAPWYRERYFINTYYNCDLNFDNETFNHLTSGIL